MFSEALRQRLEQLNRGAATTPPLSRGDSVPPSSGPAPLSFPVAPVPNFATPRPGPAALPLSGIDVANAKGTHLKLSQPISELWYDGDRTIARVAEGWSRQTLPQPVKRSDKLHDELIAFHRGFPGKTIFLDLETCGLAGSCIFLVGLLYAEQDRWSIVQLWARDYAEEKAVLHTLWDVAARHDVLVTFNGKSFDWPQVHGRSTIHGIGRDPTLDAVAVPPVSLPLRRWDTDTPRPQLAHFDLLHHARRVWRDELPNCRLQTLERRFCRRIRHDDIPGRAIPSAYQTYVRDGDTRQVRRILHHNALDLLTLLQVSICLMDKLLPTFHSDTSDQQMATSDRQRASF